MSGARRSTGTSRSPRRPFRRSQFNFSRPSRRAISASSVSRSANGSVALDVISGVGPSAPWDAGKRSVVSVGAVRDAPRTAEGGGAEPTGGSPGAAACAAWAGLGSDLPSTLATCCDSAAVAFTAVGGATRVSGFSDGGGAAVSFFLPIGAAARCAAGAATGAAWEGWAA